MPDTLRLGLVGDNIALSQSPRLHRLAAWFRRDYPSSAPTRGHCVLIALCGTDAAR